MITNQLPFPPAGGSPLRHWQNLNILARIGPVHVFAVGDGSNGTDVPAIAASWTHVDPREFTYASAGAIAAFRRLVRPREFPIENDFVTGIVNRRLAKVLEDVRPDIVVLGHWCNEIPKAINGFRPLVVDSHNIEWRLAEDLDSQRKRASLRDRIRIARLRSREERLLSSAQRIWAVSNEDVALISSLRPPVAPVDLWPNAVDVDFFRTIPDLPGERTTSPTIAFPGAFQYAPNARAAETLIDEVLPRIRRRFHDARLLFIGRDPTPTMRAAAARDAGIEVTGAVPDVRPFFSRADVVAVPLNVGGGSRLKILEAFASRRPVVSTPKGAEGIRGRDDEHFLLRDDIDGFAAACISLLEERDTAVRLVTAAHTLLVNEYSWDALGSRIESIVRALVNPASVPDAS